MDTAVDGPVRPLGRLHHYRTELAALGVARWLLYRVQRLRSRFSPAGTTFSVRTRLAAHPLMFRAGSSDLMVFRQIFVDREYRCLDGAEDVELILDCGANVGYSAAYLMTKFPSARVLAVEPDSGNVQVLRQNLEAYGSRCEVIEAGVWSHPCRLVVESQGAGAEWGVVVRPAVSDDADSNSVEAVDIPGLIARARADRVSILKVDIEGSEVEVFGDGAEQWIDRIDRLVVEIHDQVGHDVFTRAVSTESFELSTCDELTVAIRRT